MMNNTAIKKEWLEDNKFKFQKIVSMLFGGNEQVKYNYRGKQSSQFLLNYFDTYVEVFNECPSVTISRKNKVIKKNYYSFIHNGEKISGYHKIGVGKYEVFTKIYTEKVFISVNGWTHKGNKSDDKFVHVLYHISKPKCFNEKWNRWESEKSYPWAVIK